MNPRIEQILLQVAPLAGEDGEYLPSLHTTEDIELFARLIQKDTIRSLRDMFQENSTNWLILNAIIETGFKE